MQESLMMAKDETIIMRVDADTKEKIERAARDRGLTITSFVVEAATEAASRSGRVIGAELLKRFTASCQDAQRGGATGYARAGVYLAEHAFSSLDAAELKKLRAAADVRDHEAVLEWFASRYPKLMEQVPARRKRAFVNGVYIANYRRGKKDRQHAR